VTIADSPAHSRITIQSDDGFLIAGTWAARSGGNRTSTEDRYHEGGELFREEVAGSPATTENMTLSRPFKRDRDIALLRWAHRNAGRRILHITEQPLDDDGNAFGDPLVDTARLLGCNRPDVDADNTGSRKRIEFTVAPFGDIG
jgi:hypothetical protein